MNKNRIKNIRQDGKTAKGQKELTRHLEGQRPTLKQAVYAHCYDCMGYFADGKVDCGLKHCSLHPFMAYNVNRIKKVTKRTLTDEHKEKLHAARH